MASAIALCLCIAITYALFVTKQNADDDSEQSSRFDAAVFAEDIAKLNQRVSELKHIDEMIVDLKLCKPSEVHKYFRMEWMSDDGNNRAIDFMADGQNDTTYDILNMAVMRRAELNQEIADMICDLYENAIEMAYDECYEQSCPGEWEEAENI